MVKKGAVTPAQLNKVVELREAGFNWTEIERETSESLVGKVKRRLAKRVYNEHVEDKRRRELQKVRFRIAAEAFREHLNSLLKLAEALSNHLSLPGPDPDDTRSAEQYISDLWKASILEEFNLSDASVDERVRRARSNERHNLRLFKSLQRHTADEKRGWQAFDEWKAAWDSCRALSGEAVTAEKDKMEKALVEVAEMLDKQKLYPVLLKTECELCPA